MKLSENIDKMIKIEVNEGRLPWIVGSGTVVFGILVGVLLILKPSAAYRALIVGYLVILLIIGSGVCLCLEGRNRKLALEGAMLSYSSLFGKKKTFSVDEIGYCQTALERNKDYLKLYDLRGEKLCKIEYTMKNSELFLQYLIDNRVKIECSENSDILLKTMLATETICPEQIPEKAGAVYEKAKSMVLEWSKNNKNLGAEWEMGIAQYPEAGIADGIAAEKKLWECEDYLVTIEGYLKKEGKYVLDKKNQAVKFSHPVVYVSESLSLSNRDSLEGKASAGREFSIRFLGNTLEELSQQLEIMAEVLPRNRYHTEENLPHHELKERL